VVAPPGECLWVKADMMFAGNTVLLISERVRGVHEDALCKLTLPLPLPRHEHSLIAAKNNIETIHYFIMYTVYNKNQK